jgi:hypothetical protein
MRFYTIAPASDSVLKVARADYCKGKALLVISFLSSLGNVHCHLRKSRINHGYVD